MSDPLVTAASSTVSEAIESRRSVRDFKSEPAVFPGAYHNRGFALEASGRHARAMADFIEARALGMGRLPARSPDRPPPLR